MPNNHKNKTKIHYLKGTFKNIRGKGQNEAHESKKIWFRNNFTKDFICIQEAKAKSFDGVSHWFPMSWHDNIKYSLLQDDGCAQGGVFTAINPNSNLKIKSHTEIVKGRAQILHLQWGSFLSFYLINIYLPSGNSKSTIKERDTCLNSITNHIKSIPKKNKSHFIIGGDWNTIHNALDASYARNIVNLEALDELNMCADLFDFAAHTKDPEDLYTRSHKSDGETHYTRLDKALTSHSLVEFINSISVHSALLESDHDAVEITLQNKMDHPHKAQWRFPNALLKDPTFVQDFEEKWQQEWEGTTMTPKKWEKCKSWIRKFTIDWQKSKGRDAQISAIKKQERMLTMLTKRLGNSRRAAN